MTKKTNNLPTHTGFRNEALFCFHCGGSQKLAPPLPVTEAIAAMSAFDLLHSTCPQSWIEPVATPDGRTEAENVTWWLLNGEQGLSAKTMLKRLHDSAMTIREFHPSDPDDFRRCHLLLEAVPQFRQKLGQMRAVSAVWSRLVDSWDELTALLLEQMIKRSDNGMYEKMKTLGC